MSATKERIAALAGEAEALAPWTGGFDAELLGEWLRLELGSEDVLDEWVGHGQVKTRAVALSPVLHVASGNTPHAVFQSVLRGLLMGCVNWVKLPSAGLPDFERWAGRLPPVLAELLEVRHGLPEEWLDCEAAVIFGDAKTMEVFRGKLPGHVRRIEHGPKMGVAFVFESTKEAAAKVAEDVLRHDQRGCMSVQTVYVDGGEAAALAFGDLLARALEGYRKKMGRGVFTLSDSGAVSNAREVARFRMANGAGVKLWESKGSTDWTVVYERDPKLAAGPLNGFVRLHAMPDEMAELGNEAAFISTAAIHPFSEKHAARIDALGAPRICEAGKAQEPTVFWHHDGMAPLASLVRWRDLG